MTNLSSGKDRIAPVFQGVDRTYSYTENQIANATVANLALSGSKGFSDNRGITGYRFVTLSANGKVVSSGSTSQDKAFTVTSAGVVKITQLGARNPKVNDFETNPSSNTYYLQARDAAGNWSLITPITLKKTDISDTNPTPNNPATISGQATALLIEAGLSAGVSSASGTLTVSDLDAGQNSFKTAAAAALQGTYGAFSFNNGAWSYLLNNADPDTNALAAGVTVTDTLVVTSFDGTASQAITVTITGANDPASISGTAAGSLSEDAALTSTSGVLSISDVDTGESFFKSPASLQGTYGAFSFNNGAWSYVLDNADPDTNALAAGVTVTDTLVVTSFDGTASQAITVTVTGANDVLTNSPASITGSAAGALTENAALTSTSGVLSVSDADVGENSFQTVANPQTKTYGEFTFNNGAWSYLLNNADPDTNALAAGVTVTDTLVVTCFDGTASQAITVTITGANDPASISGTAAGSLLEDAALTSTSGVLSISDVDTGESSFKSPASQQGTYGAFSFDNGAWSYVLNNTDPDTNALAAGVTVTDTLVVTSFDGTASQAITVTVTGANDPASISGTATGALTETDGLLSTGGSLSISDVDTGESSFVSRSNVAGSAGFGIFNINSNGVWSYVTNSANSADALTAGETVTDSFVVTSFDGTASQTISVTITGTERTIIVDASGTAFVDTDGNGVQDAEETTFTPNGLNFGEDQITVVFTGIPTTENGVSLNGFGSDDKIIINYAAMENPFALTSGKKAYFNFKTLSSGWGGLTTQPPAFRSAQVSGFTVARATASAPRQIRLLGSNASGKFKAIFSDPVNGILKQTRTFATWGSGTSISLASGGQVTVTWPTVPPGIT